MQDWLADRLLSGGLLQAFDSAAIELSSGHGLGGRMWYSWFLAPAMRGSPRNAYRLSSSPLARRNPPGKMCRRA